MKTQKFKFNNLKRVTTFYHSDSKTEYIIISFDNPISKNERPCLLTENILYGAVDVKQVVDMTIKHSLSLMQLYASENINSVITKIINCHKMKEFSKNNPNATDEEYMQFIVNLTGTDNNKYQY